MSIVTPGKHILFFVFLAVAVTVPFVAYAGFISFVSGVFKNEESAPVVQNSQTMALLQAAVAPHNEASGGGNITIANGNSLLAETSGTPVADKNKATDQITVYVVRKGDTLSGIAKMFDVTVNTIIWSNDIKNNTVSPGDRLVILPISGVRHVVKSGDTLQSIATKYKGDINDIAEFNEIGVNTKLSVGDMIIIPDGEMLSGHDTTPGKSAVKATTAKLQEYLSAPKYDGYYIRPLIGGVKTQGIHGHNGVDIASAFGSDILAAAAGQVIVAKSSGYNGGYGSYIVIEHKNGTQTLYAHLSGVQVSVGDDVYQGQVIGNMGSTGKSTGTHLHFEVRGARNPF